MARKEIGPANFRMIFDAADMIGGAKATRAQMAAVRKAAKDLQPTLGKNERQIALLSQAYKKGKIDLEAYLRLSKQYEKAARRERRQNSLLYRSLKRLNSVRFNVGMGGMVGTAGIALGFRKIIRDAEAFNQAMAQSTAIVTGMNAELRADMARTAQSVAFDTKYSAKEASDAYYYLFSAGLDIQQSLQALPVTARFAQAGMFDLSRATDILTDSQSALGLASKDANKHMLNMNRVGNVIVGAATKANASVEQFGDALMNKGALAAKLVGMEVEEAMSILMVFADKGFAKGVEGGQALWMALRDLKTKAVENKTAFQDMGIRVDAGGGKFAKMADIVRDMDAAFEGLEPLQVQRKLAALGLPSKSLAPILTLLGTADQLRDYERYLNNLGDTMKEVADKQMTPLGIRVNELKATWESFATAVGEPITTGLAGATEDVGIFAKSLAFTWDMVHVIGRGFASWSVVWARFNSWVKRTNLAISEMVGLSSDVLQRQRQEAADAANAYSRLIGEYEDAGKAGAPGTAWLMQVEKQIKAARRRRAEEKKTWEAERNARKERERDARIPSGNRSAGMLGMLTPGLEGGDVASGVADYIKKLREAIRDVGKTDHERKLAQLEDEGAWPREIEQVKQLQRELRAAEEAQRNLQDAKDKLKEDQERSDELRKAAKTPKDIYREELNEIYDLANKFGWSMEEITAAKEKAAEKLRKPIRVSFRTEGAEAIAKGSKAAQLARYRHATQGAKDKKRPDVATKIEREVIAKRNAERLQKKRAEEQAKEKQRLAQTQAQLAAFDPAMVEDIERQAGAPGLSPAMTAVKYDLEALDPAMVEAFGMPDIPLPAAMQVPKVHDVATRAIDHSSRKQASDEKVLNELKQIKANTKLSATRAPVTIEEVSSVL